MLKLRKVAITGSLSCGKSSVCRILKELGAYVVSSDEIVHQLLLSDTNLGQKIVNLLGPEVWGNQKLDRSRIAHIVFQNRELLQALEKLMHPVVYKELDKEYQKQQHLPYPPPLFVAEIPLLFETGGEKEYDKTVVVLADPEVCLKRFQQATGAGQQEFNYRMARQISPLDKAKQADYVLLNNGTWSDLKQSTKKLYENLIS